MNSCKRFLKDDSGAVSVDWVVITAGVTVLGTLVVFAYVRPAIVQVAIDMGAFIMNYQEILQTAP